MFRNKIVFLLLVLILVSFSSCDKIKSKKNDDADGSVKVNHVIELRHVSFDTDKNGLVIDRPDTDPVLVSPSVPKEGAVLEEVLHANGFMIAQTIEGSISTLRLDTSNNKLNNDEIAALLQGMSDYFAGNELKEDYLADLDARVRTYAEDIQKQKDGFATAYFDAIKADENIVKTESGLMYKVITKGDGEEIKYDDAEINVDYTMNVFDNFAEDKKDKVDSNVDTKFTVNQLIPGVIEGLQLMREGDEYEFYIIPELGYGIYGAPPRIPSNAYLIFNIKVNKIITPSASGKDKPAETNADGNVETQTTESASPETN